MKEGQYQEFNIEITLRQYLESEKLTIGAFNPVTSFMDEKTVLSVANEMRLLDGSIFPLPIMFDIQEDIAKILNPHDILHLYFQNLQVGELYVESVFSLDKSFIAKKIFGTTDINHPGVSFFQKMHDFFVSGTVILKKKVIFDYSSVELSPTDTRNYFKNKNWKTVVGFQTRNVPHRAHEYLLRMGLENADGLFIQPLVGRKKIGDYTPEAILKAYNVLIETFLPKDRILLGVLSTEMRYAGPREALFHAIIRRNYGCTHFIIGRDHAGVGNYYGKYEAHELVRKYEKELGISILYCTGPFYCQRCGMIVSERTCPHYINDPDSCIQINGTDMRNILCNDLECPSELIRPEIVKSVDNIACFIGGINDE